MITDNMTKNFNNVNINVCMMVDDTGHLNTTGMYENIKKNLIFMYKYVGSDFGLWG
jgi:hypothetical protein